MKENYKKQNNIDPLTVLRFGEEWTRFNQSKLSYSQQESDFLKYFKVFPWDMLSSDSVGFDMGCGTGRWANFTAPRVGVLHCIEPSSAIKVAEENLKKLKNITFHHKSTDTITIEKNSMDFGYSLGVVHHVPDTKRAIKSCVNLLKTGAPLLLYVYYSFENKPMWYKYVWVLSDAIRRVVILFPTPIVSVVSDILAILVYWPLSRLSKLLELFGLNSSNTPLYEYRNKTLYTLRTDARDRFGTPLEKRFSRAEMIEMMTQSGLENIVFSDEAPFWCVVGYKK